MKEKIERFSKGTFEYEQPFLMVSEEKIKLSIEAGKVHEGCITIKNSAGRSMKGVLYSSNRLFTLGCSSFSGPENTITYRFIAEYLNEGEKIEGELSIVSDCGEYVVPYYASIEAPYCATSIGKVKDLFQFANLARMDWTEAKKVFRSDDFERVILKNEEKYRVLYRSLLKNISTSQALEEFLIAVHKKPKVELSINKTKLEYRVYDEEFMDKLILTKNHWGYAEIRVSTDAPFIQLEQKFVWADRFIGNTQQISFLIVPKNMRRGNNFGRIYIKTVHQTIIVEVTCRHVRFNQKELLNRRAKERAICGFTRNYLDFRIGRISLGRYVEGTQALFTGIEDDDGSFKTKLIRTHLAIISDRRRQAGQLLAEIAEDEEKLKKNSVPEYCAYLYLDALYRKEEDIVKRAAETISWYYDNGYDDWRILWLLFYTGTRYEKNKSQKLADIREHFEAGLRSPVMYYEAMLVYNEEPYQLRDLGDFEIQVLGYGIRNRMLKKELVQQYTYLANRRKTFNPIIFRGLASLYNEYGSNEILSAICCMLIKGIKRSERYFEWYKRGVEAQLRITELYEYFMYSADEASDEPLPQPVLLYFIYNSSLSDKKRAYLYANIIRHKASNEAIYRTYYKRMEVFAQKQLDAHNISPNLAVLYKEFMDKSSITEDMEERLPDVIFTYELTCGNPDIVYVTVIHKELEEEENIPITGGKAYIQLYTKNALIFLTDTIGNRYTVSIDYTLRPLFSPEYIAQIKPDKTDKPRLLLHLNDHYREYRVMSESSIDIRRRVLLIPGLKPEYYADCLLAIIDYYYDAFDEMLFRHYLAMVDLGKVNEADRMKFMEYMVTRGYYDKALEALEIYGFEGISVNRLLRLASAWISEAGPENGEELLVSLCHYIFTNGKYDDVILEFLVSKYYGPIPDMMKVWHASRDFGIDTRMLEERILVQMLFSESNMEDSFKVFGAYYKNITNHTLVRAYLSYWAYKYLASDNLLSPELMPIMRRELNYEENDICLLAWLKYNASGTVLSENELEYISYSINRLENKGIVLPFLLEYADRIDLPERIADKVYVEYRSNPDRQVYIHYRLVKNSSSMDYVIERMPNVILGIHVKGFTLFCNEVLQYYITEELDGVVNITESQDLHIKREIPEDASRYSQLNRMLRTAQQGDDKLLLDMMDSYARQEYMIEECFKRL